jgi:thiol-disulfide isomerase/thioredoxin
MLPAGITKSMNSKSRLLETTIIIVGLCAPSPGSMIARALQNSPAEGQRPPAPGFTLIGIYGQKVSLKSYRNEVVLVNFWAAWCGPCRAEIPELRNLKERYGSDGFQIVGVAMDDDAQPVREFSQQFRINYPVLMADDKIASLFGGISVLPTTFLIGRDGRIDDLVQGPINLARIVVEIEAALFRWPNRKPQTSQSSHSSSPSRAK